MIEIRLTPDQEALIGQAFAAGRISRPEDAGQEAMALWEEREHRRSDILAAIDEAEASLLRGEGRIVTPDSMRRLAEDVRERGRTRCRRAESRPLVRRFRSSFDFPAAPPTVFYRRRPVSTTRVGPGLRREDDNRRSRDPVMRGLDPRINSLSAKKIVDGRIKSGHDDLEMILRVLHIAATCAGCSGPKPEVAPATCCRRSSRTCRRSVSPSIARRPRRRACRTR